MELTISKQGATLIAKFSGELDEHSAQSARVKLDEAMNVPYFSTFIFDFTDLTFMDSTGIGMMLGRYKKLKKLGALTCIAQPNAHVDKILRTAGIYTIIQKIG